MEIQKIFSNTENEEEKLYSVSMSEDEINLYSQFQKEFNSKAQKALRKKYEEKLGNGNVTRGRVRNNYLKQGIDPLQERAKGNEAFLVNSPVNKLKLQAKQLMETNEKVNDEIKNKVSQIEGKFIDNEKQAVNNAAKKNVSYLGKGLKFAKNHKLGVGIAGAGLATAGTAAYLYNKKKNKEN